MKVVELAPAKLNLTLDVGAKHHDGYHDVTSVMTSAALHDMVTVESKPDGGIRLSCSDATLPCDESNLAYRAAKLFFDHFGIECEGLHIHLEKHIPMQAGLGGGSAGAAAVLRALNRHYGSPLSILALAELGAQVGSDVPFCTLCGTAMVEGRGERLRKLPDLPDCFFVVVKPDFSASTPELYKKLDETVIAHRPDNRAMEAALLAGDLEKVVENIYNVFDPVVTADHLEMNYIKSICNSYGSLGQQMTGSGSAVFAVLTSFEYAAVVCQMLKENYPNVYIAKPV